MATEMSLAIELPVAAAPEIDAVVADFRKRVSIKVKKPTAESGSGASALTFDPVTGTAIGWFVLKFAGETAVAVIAAVVGDLIHKKLKARAELASKTVRVRFPDGTVSTLIIADPNSMAELQRLLEQKAWQ